MKASAFLSLLLAAATSAARAENWVNFILQDQVNSDVVWHMPVDAEGEASSHLALPEGGALFQLWTVRQQDQKDYLLDQKLVGAYMPAAEIEIETLDPYPNVHRTRADVPFTVHIDVSRLLSGPNLPEAAKKVLLERHLAPYTGGRTSIDPREATGGDPAQHAFLEENGRITYDGLFPQLPAADPTKANGEEHFVVHALPDGTTEQTTIASEHVEVWPLADGRIHGIQQGEIVSGTMPKLTLDLRDLYPSSTTYLQIYEGPEKVNTTGTRVDGSVLVLDQDTSEDRTLMIEDWAGALEGEGTHTMELVTTDPFGSTRLAYVEFEFDRSLEIRAHMGDIETGASRARN